MSLTKHDHNSKCAVKPGRSAAGHFLGRLSGTQRQKVKNHSGLVFRPEGDESMLMHCRPRGATIVSLSLAAGIDIILLYICCNSGTAQLGAVHAFAETKMGDIVLMQEAPAEEAGSAMLLYLQQPMNAIRVPWQGCCRHRSGLMMFTLGVQDSAGIYPAKAMDVQTMQVP